MGKFYDILIFKILGIVTQYCCIKYRNPYANHARFIRNLEWCQQIGWKLEAHSTREGHHESFVLRCSVCLKQFETPGGSSASDNQWLSALVGPYKPVLRVLNQLHNVLTSLYCWYYCF